MGLTDTNNSVPVCLYPSLSLPAFFSFPPFHSLSLYVSQFSPSSSIPSTSSSLFARLPVVDRTDVPSAYATRSIMYLRGVDPTRIMHWQPSDNGDSVTCLGKSTAPLQHPYSKSCDPTNPSVPLCTPVSHI
jgi:hypothetical protein